MVKNKLPLCASEPVNFTAIEGEGNYPLYKRYNALQNIIESTVSEPYRHFLAQPVEQDDKLIWHAVPWVEQPRHLDALSGEEFTKYNAVKEDTLSHYANAISVLNQKGKHDEARMLEKVYKTIDDRFIYCFDDKLILTNWGMKAKESSTRISGEYYEDMFLKSRSVTDYTVTFNAGDEGELNGKNNLSKPAESIITADEIPTVSAKEGYQFVGWDQEPLAYKVNDNIVFNAQYQVNEQPDNSRPLHPEKKYHRVSFAAGENGDLYGKSNFEKNDGEFVYRSEIPDVQARTGYEFDGWDKNPDNYKVHEDTQFTATYKKALQVKRTWWNRCNGWLSSIWSLNWFRWLLWLLLLLLLIWLLSYLFRGCNHGNYIGSGGTITHDSTYADSRNNDENNNRENRTGGYEYLPPQSGVIIPVDTGDIGYNRDSILKIVSNRLNILIDKESSLSEFALDFKKIYPNNEYQIVYYDTLLKRLQIMIPPDVREKVRNELPSKLPKYKMFIWDEALYESNYLPNDPSLKDREKNWYINATNTPAAWDITMGSSEIVVAIVDDGFSLNHPEFKGKVTKPYNVWTKNDRIYASKVDHGTHVAGIAIANGNNGVGISGIAPNCKFMPVQVADNNGTMTISSVLDGLLYAIYNGADVINVSIGIELTLKSSRLPMDIQKDLIKGNFKEEERLWKEVFSIAEARNCSIVLAAGNENLLAGIDPIQRPENGITVSAIDKTGSPYVKSSFSNFGNYSTISAPGVAIYSTFGANGYIFHDGTSMAAPIVTGAVALMKSINRKISNSEIKKILINTGIHVTGNAGNLIQIGKAVADVKTSGKMNEQNDECSKIAREIDSLQQEINSRLRKCPALINKPKN